MYFAIRVYDDENRQNKSRDKVMLPTNENQARLVTTNQRPTEEIFAEVSIWNTNQILDMKEWVIIYASFYTARF